MEFHVFATVTKTQQLASYNLLIRNKNNINDISVKKEEEEEA